MNPYSKAWPKAHAMSYACSLYNAYLLFIFNSCYMKTLFSSLVNSSCTIWDLCCAPIQHPSRDILNIYPLLILPILNFLLFILKIYNTIANFRSIYSHTNYYLVYRWMFCCTLKQFEVVWNGLRWCRMDFSRKSSDYLLREIWSCSEKFKVA